jgi:hypothetical protein
LRKQENASKGSNGMIQKLARDPEHNLTTKPARDFATTSIGNLVDKNVRPAFGFDALKKARLLRARWVIGQFPDEVWDVPALTALYLGEACSCYVNEEYFATVAMCQAVNESFVRGAYRAARRPKSKKRMAWGALLQELERRNLTQAGKRYLKWIQDLRNTLLHVGSDQDYAKAIKLAITPIMFEGKITPFPAIETLSKIALSVTIEFVGSNSVHKEKTRSISR